MRLPSLLSPLMGAKEKREKGLMKDQASENTELREVLRFFWKKNGDIETIYAKT